MDRLQRFGSRRVTVTGGEPLLQPQTPDLVRDLLDSGYQVGVETNGSYDIGCLDRRCTRVMDVKCPSSGMQAHNRLANFALLNPGDQVKFVIADRTDFQFACHIADTLGSDFPPGDILFSAVHPRLPAAELAKWMLVKGIDARLQIQLHKYLWPDRDRGV